MMSWNIAIPIYSACFLPDERDARRRDRQRAAQPRTPPARSGRSRSAISASARCWSAASGRWSRLRSSLLSGVRSGLAAARAGAGARSVADTERDLPMKWVLVGIVLFTLPLWALYQTIVGSLAVSLPMAIIMIVAGFLFCSVSAYMAGLVGSSNNPVSGITIATILFAAVVLLVLMGRNAELGPVAAIMIGAVVCCAACIGGDNLQDLKCGQLVGATPWRQQVMLAIGAVTSALVMAPVLNLLARPTASACRRPSIPTRCSRRRRR